MTDATKTIGDEEFDIRTLMKENPDQSAPESEDTVDAPIPEDTIVLKKGILSMLGDASKTSVSSVYGYLIGIKGGNLSQAKGHEQMMDVIYDDLDSLNNESLSQVYTILSRFE